MVYLHPRAPSFFKSQRVGNFGGVGKQEGSGEVCWELKTGNSPQAGRQEQRVLADDIAAVGSEIQGGVDSFTYVNSSR